MPSPRVATGTPACRPGRSGKVRCVMSTPSCRAIQRDSVNRSRPFTEKIIFFSPRFQQLTPNRPGRLHLACYLEVEQRYSPRPGTRCPQVNARPVWCFGAGPDSALRTCGARPSGLVLQQRGARQSSGIDSVTVEVLRGTQCRAVRTASVRRPVFGPAPDVPGALSSHGCQADPHRLRTAAGEGSFEILPGGSAGP